MRTGFQVVLSVVVLASAQPGTLAQNKAPREVLHEVSLDINRDGRMDRAVLVRESHPAYTDLWIYLQTGEGALELR